MLGREREPEYIGEVYCCNYYAGCYCFKAPHTVSTDSSTGRFSWSKFTSEDRDIWKDHDDFLHIKGTCFKKTDVMFYDKVAFGAAREKIESKYRS